MIGALAHEEDALAASGGVEENVTCLLPVDFAVKPEQVVGHDVERERELRTLISIDVITWFKFGCIPYVKI